jgi:chromosome segregation ATPase
MRGSEEGCAVRTVVAIVAVLLTAGTYTSAFAQVSRGGSNSGANTQLMMQLQQAQTERAQLQAENSKLKKESEDLKKQLATAQTQLTASKAGADRNQAAVAAARASNESTQKSLDDAKARMNELVGRFRDTVTTMRGIESERSQLRQQLAASQSSYDQCAVTNDSLYQINKEVLDRYEHQGAFSYMARAEPFTRIKRTQIENQSLEYRQRAEELRVKKAAGARGTGGPTSGTNNPTTGTAPAAVATAPGPAPAAAAGSAASAPGPAGGSTPAPASPATPPSTTGPAPASPPTPH